MGYCAGGVRVVGMETRDVRGLCDAGRMPAEHGLDAVDRYRRMHCADAGEYGTGSVEMAHFVE